MSAVIPMSAVTESPVSALTVTDTESDDMFFRAKIAALMRTFDLDSEDEDEDEDETGSLMGGFESSADGALSMYSVHSDSDSDLTIPPSPTMAPLSLAAMPLFLSTPEEVPIDDEDDIFAPRSLLSIEDGAGAGLYAELCLDSSTEAVPEASNIVVDCSTADVLQSILKRPSVDGMPCLLESTRPRSTSQHRVSFNHSDTVSVEKMGFSTALSLYADMCLSDDV